MTQERIRNSPGRERAGPREAILDAAEHLIGRHGYEGVSLRQIAAAAGSANHSAVHYYFGDKDGLIQAIAARRSQNIDERRRVLIASALKKGFESDTKAIMEVLLRPIAEEKDAEGRCSFAAFLLALRIFSDISYWLSIADVPDVTRNLYQMLESSLEPLPPEIVEIRFFSATTVFLAAVVDWDQGKGFSAQAPGSREDYLDLTLNFAVAGMSAPWECGAAP